MDCTYINTVEPLVISPEADLYSIYMIWENFDPSLEPFILDVF